MCCTSSQMSWFVVYREALLTSVQTAVHIAGLSVTPRLVLPLSSRRVACRVCGAKSHWQPILSSSHTTLLHGAAATPPYGYAPESTNFARSTAFAWSIHRCSARAAKLWPSLRRHGQHLHINAEYVCWAVANVTRRTGIIGSGRTTSSSRSACQ